MTTPRPRHHTIALLLLTVFCLDISSGFAEQTNAPLQPAPAQLVPIARQATTSPVSEMRLSPQPWPREAQPTPFEGTFAQGRANQSPRRTKALWTIVGAAAGAGIGMWAGFRAFDQATYAERKITASMIAGGAIGGVVGWTIGWGRSGGAQQP